MNLLASPLLILTTIVVPAIRTAAAQAAAPSPPTLREIIEKTSPSVVLIRVEDDRAYPLSLGSGFFVADGLVATNVHVLQGGTAADVKLPGSKNEWHRVKGVVATDPANDLALLSVEIPGTASVPISTDDKPVIGDAVIAIGNPLGLEGTVSQGIVSGLRTLDARGLIQITSPISPGSSGGPVLNDHGLVIGVAVATITDGQNLNFAIPAKALRALLPRVGEPRSLDVISTDTGNSVVNALSKTTGSALTCHSFTRQNEMGFSFSAVNTLQSAMFTADFIVVFYSEDKHPLGYSLVSHPNKYDVTHPGLFDGRPGLDDFVNGIKDPRANALSAIASCKIPPGLAKRVHGIVSDVELLDLAKSYEIRVLDYTLENPGLAWIQASPK